MNDAKIDSSDFVIVDGKSSNNELPPPDNYGWDYCDFPLPREENSISASGGSFAHVEPPAFGTISGTPISNNIFVQVVAYIKVFIFLKKIRNLALE